MSGGRGPAGARARLTLDPEARRDVWRRVVDILERYAATIGDARVTPEPDLASRDIRADLEQLGLDGASPVEALELVADGLWRGQVHTPHPRYFGLFNPAPTTMSIVADALVAGFNPQLAAASHSPFAAEVQHYLVESFGERLGYPSGRRDGTFTSGGAEANHTAVLVALTAVAPEAARLGLRAVSTPPVLYVSCESHHSILKAARMCGLGTDAVHEVGTDAAWRLDPEALRARVRADRDAGQAPFLVVATAGTTAGGTVDDIGAIADVAADEGLWLHVDGAWGGTPAIFDRDVRDRLGPFARADSVTVDAHKWMSVPMAAGIFLTRRPELLEPTFRVETAYMPASERWAAGDPYARSMQWTRRFIGLKVYLSLAVAGWEGYAATVRDMVALGDTLRAALRENGWRVVNESPLPVVCFVEADGPGRDGPGRDGSDGDGPADDPASASRVRAVAERVNDSGQAWISTVRLGGRVDALRACITNHRTTGTDVRALIDTLDRARRTA